MVTASDRGNGIAQLDDILAGRYRSKSGLGKGLSGVRKIADRFDVHSAPTGTRVEAEVEL
jgi:serine/threonine-protein kinase RsbT